jgi:hypothetical protein
MLRQMALSALFVSLAFINLSAKTPYFYYYDGEKQYFELDKRYIFVSATDVKIATDLNIEQQDFRTDISDDTKIKTGYTKRVWTKLEVKDILSDEAYLARLSEIKNKGKNIITAPYFKSKRQDEIGLSNFLYVKLKSLRDTVLLKQEAQKEAAVVVRQNQFMPEWFVVSVTENSKYNAMELANRFFESGLFQYAEPDLMIDV